MCSATVHNLLTFSGSFGSALACLGTNLTYKVTPAPTPNFRQDLHNPSQNRSSERFLGTTILCCLFWPVCCCAHTELLPSSASLPLVHRQLRSQALAQQTGPPLSRINRKQPIAERQTCALPSTLSKPMETHVPNMEHLPLLAGVPGTRYKLRKGRPHSITPLSCLHAATISTMIMIIGCISVADKCLHTVLELGNRDARQPQGDQPPQPR